MAENVGAVQYAVQQSLNAANENWFNTRSRLALMQEYGPMYANPQFALQAQQAEHQRQMTPLQVSGERQRQNFLEQYYPLQVESQRLQNVVTGEQGQQQRVATETLRGQQQRQGLTALINEMERALDAGHPPDKVFDAALPTASRLSGVAPEQFEPYREHFNVNPREALAGMKRSLTAIEWGFTAPKERAAIAKEALAAQKTQAETINEQLKQPKNVLEMFGAKSPQELTAQLGAKKALFEQISAARLAIDEARDLLKKVPAGTVYRFGAQYAPGSPTAELSQKLEQIINATGLTALQKLRMSGLTLGQITEKEHERTAHSVINIKTTNRLGFIEKELDRLAKTYDMIVADAQKDIQRTEQAAALVGRYYDTRTLIPPDQSPVNMREMVSPFMPTTSQTVQNAVINQAIQGRPTGTGTSIIPSQTPQGAVPQAPVPGGALATPGAETGNVVLPGGKTIPVPQWRALPLNERLKLLLGN